MENEHLNNCGNFRAVRDISVKPVQAEVRDELTIEQLMDHEHGPLPKRRVMNLLLNQENPQQNGAARIQLFDFPELCPVDNCDNS